MLEGLRVVELATYVAGPSAATVLADWGAEVIKVESHAGDPTRHIFAAEPDIAASPVFEFENRGKRGCVIDIAKPAGRNALIAILERADIFITNLRTHSLARAGLDYSALSDRLPRLIYCSVSGYGLEGDHVDLPAFDIAALWTRAGVASLTTPQGVEPFACRPGFGDSICALATVSAVLASVHERQKTGRGRLVETSLIRAGVYAVGWDMSIQLKLGRSAPTQNRREKINPASNYFRTSDQRWICVLIRRPTDFAAMVAAMGAAPLAGEQRFATPLDRAANAPALVDALDAVFAALTLEEAGARLTAADVMWAPLQTPADVVADPFARAAGCFVEVCDRAGDRFLSPASPARFPGAVDVAARRAPGHGEHTAEVLAEAGYGAEEIDALFADGIAARIEP